MRRDGHNLTCIGSGYTPEQVQFIRAMDRLRRNGERPHPTAREVLAAAKSLGYRKVK